jgi:hypothetical protein
MTSPASEWSAPAVPVFSDTAHLRRWGLRVVLPLVLAAIAAPVLLEAGGFPAWAVLAAAIVPSGTIAAVAVGTLLLGHLPQRA